MVYKYKCIKAKHSFTPGKIYTLDTKQKTFLSEYGTNCYSEACNGNKDLRTLAFCSCEFILINPPAEKKITIKRVGNKVIAKMGNKVAESKCHPDDEFDYYVGCRLALDKLFTDPNPSKKSQSNELKVHDRVKIIKPGLLYTKYVDYFSLLLNYGFSEEDVKDLTSRYNYGNGRGFELYLTDPDLYIKLYGNIIYKVISIDLEDYVVIESTADSSVSIITKDGIEKVTEVEK